MSYKPSTFNSFINTNISDSFGKIYTHAKRIYNLNKRLNKLLPKEIAGRCVLANINNDSALFYANSAAWAVKSRFMAPTLTAILRDQLGLTEIKSIRVKVSVTLPDNKPIYTRPTLSAKSSRLITQFAKTLDDAKLQASLMRLAKNSTD